MKESLNPGILKPLKKEPCVKNLMDIYVTYDIPSLIPINIIKNKKPTFKKITYKKYFHLTNLAIHGYEVHPSSTTLHIL
jgi:hypothetical protein